MAVPTYFGMGFYTFEAEVWSMSTTRGKGGRFLEEVVADSSHGLFVVDPSGRVVFSNGVLEDCLDFEPGDVLEERLDDLSAVGDVLGRVRDAAAASPGEVVEFVLRDADGERVPMWATCETTEFEGTRYITLWCEEQCIGADCETVGGAARRGVAVDELTGTWRDLIRAESPTEAAEVGLAAVERFLGTEVACVRLVGEESNALERAATTEQAAELLASEPVFDLNRSLAGRAFRRGEPVLDRPEGSGDLARENLHVPLDGRGTLSVFGTGTGLSAREVDVAEDLASVVAAGIDRAATGPDDPAAGGTGAFELPVREVVASAVGGETREAIGKEVCEGLVVGDAFGGAWFVETDVDGAWRAVEASAGATDSPPEGVRRAADGADGSDDPVSRAVESDDVCLVRRRRTVQNGSERAGSNETVETAVVVPVGHGGRTYGVLVLRTDAGEVGSAVRSELALLGDVVGLAVYAAQSKKLLLSERVQQLELEVTDPGCLAVAVSEATDGFCEVEHQTLTNDGDHLCYLQVEDATPEEARGATADIGPVTDCRVVDTGDGECLLEVVKTRSGAEAMMDVGATVRRATADGGVGTLVVEAPLSADVREIVDAYTAQNPGSHLVAKREIDRSVPAAGALATSVNDVLTEKQQSVLTAAYYAGYFEWPRANTAEEVADSLGISPATLHQHLRTAERKLLDLVCEEQSHLR